MLESLHHDLKHALRRLAKNRAYTAVAVLSVALGVGANAAIFSLVDQALYRRLPVREPERLVLLSWNGRFVGSGCLGGRADVVGLRVKVNNHPMTVVGVAAQGFRGLDFGEVPALFVPLMMARQALPDFDWLDNRRGRFLHVFGRLKPDVSQPAAAAGLKPWFKAMLDADMQHSSWPVVSAEERTRFLASSLDVLQGATGRSDLRQRLEQPLYVCWRRPAGCCCSRA